ncbi:SAM-dependent methyltransferase, partial [Vibrio sp.]|nr:SAM-dependent methyltransferase [Vibrio sp.]
FLPGLKELHDTINLTVEGTLQTDVASNFEFSGIPGRKQVQIREFTHRLTEKNIGSEWLEWCAGKGYLGRVLHLDSGKPVKSLEFQHSLCEAGQIYAEENNLDIRFQQIDVFHESVIQLMNVNQHAVALHACGDLHCHLIKLATKKRLSAISISPCCFHLIRDEFYQPLSSEAQASGIRLSKKELRIPLQKVVTGGMRVEKHRFLEMTFRLGLQALIEEKGLAEHYVPFPSIKKSVLKYGFESFCREAFKYKGWDLDAEVDLKPYQDMGIRQFKVMERLNLLQSLFQSLLEAWLIYDKALFLKQQGYDVSVSRFCPEHITPRNYLIQAIRADTN